MKDHAEYIDMDDLDKEIIADSLANMMDWDCDNLQDEFRLTMEDNFPRINPALVNYLFEEYLKLDTLTRSRPSFNHIAFVAEKIESFKTDRLH